MYTRNVKALGVAALICLLLPAAAFAKDPEGVWRGKLKGKQGEVAATFTFDAKNSSAHFEAPYLCKVPIVRGAGDGDLSYTFGTTVNGGRFCQDLQNVKLELTQASDESLSVTFTSDRAMVGRGTWSGTLTPSPASNP
jgi:hypothetical protein